jgi:hypothetical protein
MLLTIAYFALGFGGPVFAADHPDFSGHWSLNLDQSRFRNSPKPTGMTLVATHNGDTMHAVQTMDSEGGPVTTESEWIPDGKEHDGPNGSKTMTRWDGDTLYTERQSADGTLQERVWLVMSKDGKTATEKVWTKTATGTNVRTLVWRRT